MPIDCLPIINNGDLHTYLGETAGLDAVYTAYAIIPINIIAIACKSRVLDACFIYSALEIAQCLFHRRHRNIGD